MHKNIQTCLKLSKKQHKYISTCPLPYFCNSQIFEFSIKGSFLNNLFKEKFIRMILMEKIFDIEGKC